MSLGGGGRAQMKALGIGVTQGEDGPSRVRKTERCVWKVFRTVRRDGGICVLFLLFFVFCFFYLFMGAFVDVLFSGLQPLQCPWHQGPCWCLGDGRGGRKIVRWDSGAVDGLRKCWWLLGCINQPCKMQDCKLK